MVTVRMICHVIGMEHKYGVWHDVTDLMRVRMVLGRNILKF